MKNYWLRQNPIERVGMIGLFINVGLFTLLKLSTGVTMGWENFLVWTTVWLVGIGKRIYGSKCVPMNPKKSPTSG